MSDLTTLDANYCMACGKPVGKAQTVAITGDEPLDPKLTGTFEQAGAHAVVGQNEIQIFHHVEDDQ